MIKLSLNDKIKQSFWI